VWQTGTTLVDPWEATRTTTKYVRKEERFYPLNTELDKLTLQTRLKDVLAGGANTILLVAEADIGKLRRPPAVNPSVSEPNLDGSSGVVGGPA
jgi:hypothetical protein